jgi:rod shape-determining protein MreC
MAKAKKPTKILSFIFLLLVFLSFFYFQNSLKNSVYLVSSIFQKNFWVFGKKISNFLEGIVFSAKLKEENLKLKEENEKLTFENLSLQNQAKENEILKKALDINLTKDFDLEFAKIVGKDISQDTILIDKGAKDGISENLPVISENKSILGKVIKVYKNFSKVQLISHPESIFDVKIQDKGILGKAKGRGNQKISIEYLPLKENIQPGELVISAGQSGIFPEGLLVGKIEKIKKSDLEGFQEAEVSPFLNITDLEYLFIIKSW